jgi:tetratricopeptide (TPR) repeat protein
MLNRALTTMDVDVIIKMGFFIRDLLRQIAELHAEQFDRDDNPPSFTVYRGQSMVKTDFDQLMKTKGGLLAFNNFLSTSKNQEISLHFAKQAQNATDLVGVLFVMKIDPSISFIPFASIKGFCDNKESDDEILFSMHSVFRICDIKQIDNNTRLWEVHLALTSDSDPQLNILTERIREETQGPTARHRLGKFLYKLGEFNKAETLNNALLPQTRDIQEKSILYDQLGMTKAAQGEYQEAIRFYENALEIRQNALPANHPDLAVSYSNIGLVYDNLGEYSKALSYQEKALEIREKTSPLNHLDSAVSYNNIGCVYNNMGEHSKALSSHEKALEIRQNMLSTNDPVLAESYDNVGLVYDNMGEYSKAVALYEKALNIRQAILPTNHPDLGASYNNIGVTYNNMHEYSKALPFHEKALEIRQKTIPSNRPNLAETYYNISLAYENTGKHSKALQFCKQAVEIGQLVLLRYHPKLQQWQKKLETIESIYI